MQHSQAQLWTYRSQILALPGEFPRTVPSTAIPMFLRLAVDMQHMQGSCRLSFPKTSPACLLHTPSLAHDIES